MFSLFTISDSQSATSGPRGIDLQLLSDEEVLRIWDQSQTVISMLEEQGMPIHMSATYSVMIEQELQNRAQANPINLFQASQKTKDTQNPSTKKSILATNILL